MADEGHDVQRDRALGALTGLRVGEVLGAVTDGLPAATASTALDSAFPDFSVATPAFAEALSALGVQERGECAGLVAAGCDAPQWVSVAVATGLQVRADPIAQLVEALGERLPAPHRNRLTFAAGAAVAGAVSAALDETSWSQCLSLAISAADLAEAAAASVEAYRAGASVGARLAWAHALGTRAEDALEIIELLVGVSEMPQEAVPAAFAVIGARAGAGSGPREPMSTVRSAATLGGRAGLIAPVAGALAGALAGVAAFPAHLRDDIELTRVLAGREAG